MTNQLHGRPKLADGTPGCAREPGWPCPTDYCLGGSECVAFPSKAERRGELLVLGEDGVPRPLFPETARAVMAEARVKTREEAYQRLADVCVEVLGCALAGSLTCERPYARAALAALHLELTGQSMPPSEEPPHAR